MTIHNDMYTIRPLNLTYSTETGEKEQRFLSTFFSEQRAKPQYHTNTKGVKNNPKDNT